MVTINVLNIEGKATLPIHGDGKPESLAAGYDVVAVDNPTIVGEIGREIKLEDGTLIPLYKSISYLEYHTALKVQPLWNEWNTHKEYHHLDMHPRSSVRKYNLLLANSIGLIDNDYRGEILVSFKYVFQPEDFVIEYDEVKNADGTVLYVVPKGILSGINQEKIYKKGDKIAQLVAEKTNPCNYVFTSELTATVRGEGGHGSTGQTATTSFQGEVKTLTDRYVAVGGVPTKKRYSDEMKERERIEGAPRQNSGTVIPQPGFKERK